MTLPSPFAVELGCLMTARGMTAYRVDQEIGTAQGITTKYLSGVRNPSRAMVGRFARALRLDRVEQMRLYALAGYLPPLSVDERERVIAAVAGVIGDHAYGKITGPDSLRSTASPTPHRPSCYRQEEG